MSFDVVVEIPAKTNVKYEIDEKTGEIRVDRFLHTCFVYPFNYGYIRKTNGQDNDPLDAIVLSSEPVHPGTIIRCHQVGLLEMEDEEGVDTKIVAVPDKNIDPIYGKYNSISELPKHTIERIRHFFDHYKELEPGKWVKVRNFRPKGDAEIQIKKASI